MNLPDKDQSKDLPKPISTVVVGFGLSGSVFHAPFLNRHPLFRLQGIVSSKERSAIPYPKLQLYRTLDEALSRDEVELVVICSPHPLHFQQAAMALEAGKHVIVEKPLALHSEKIMQLGQLALQKQKLLIPYHNRRRDGDFLTVKQILNNGMLGTLLDFESRFDRFSPTARRAEWRYSNESAGGTLFDIAPHLIDQCLVLFGKPLAVHATLLFHRQQPQCNDGFDIRLFYGNLIASLKAGVFVRLAGPRFQLHGTKGSFVKYGFDPQEANLKKNHLFDPTTIGLEPKTHFGMLQSSEWNGGKAAKYPGLPGNYMAFYSDIAASILHQEPPDINWTDAYLGLKIIEAAIESNQTKKNVEL